MVATPLADRSSGLDDLLREARHYSAEFPVDLANHGPMALIILDRLGAPDQRLREYFDAYRLANGLVPVPPTIAPIERETWALHLGDRAREGDYRAFFGREVSRLGIRDAVNRYLPTLLPGVAGSALHPLMRLAYGILRNDPAETATGPRLLGGVLPAAAARDGRPARDRRSRRGAGARRRHARATTPAGLRPSLAWHPRGRRRPRFRAGRRLAADRTPFHGTRGRDLAGAVRRHDGLRGPARRDGVSLGPPRGRDLPRCAIAAPLLAGGRGARTRDRLSRTPEP